MYKTYLLQRFSKPNPTATKIYKAFGGNALMLREEAWELLEPVLTIDYMGAAEYEFGALPRALCNLSEGRRAVFSFDLKAKEIKPNWQREVQYRKQRQKELAEAKAAGVKAKRAKKVTTPHGKTIYVICLEKDRYDAETRIRELAADQWPCKSSPGFCEALDPMTESDAAARGWLDLDNALFFTVDKAMWEGLQRVFESLQ